MDKFLERLNECRNGMSVSAFARFLGLNQKTLDLYIKGERKPSVELVLAVCSKCGRSADWLLGITTEVESKQTDWYVRAIVAEKELDRAIGENHKKSFSDRITSLIGDGESVLAFSRRIGMNQAAIDRYIKGMREPNADALRKISIACAVSTDWLLGLADSPDGVNNSDWRSRALAAERKLDRVNSALAHALKGFEELQEAVK